MIFQSDLSEKWIKIHVIYVENKVHIRLLDSGNGIPKELADKIMEPFYTTKGVGKGAGLGFSIARSIVENHGGKLWIDVNSPNTCFVIEIPTAESGNLSQSAA